MHKNRRRAIKQTPCNIRPRVAIRSRGKGNHLPYTHRFNRCSNLPIFGTKIMPPFGDAMGFINRDALHTRTRQSALQTIHCETLWRYKQ